MKHTLSLNDGKTVYEFDDEAEYQGKMFISFHKQTTFKDQKKHQNMTVKVDDWEEFSKWMQECLDGKAPDGEEAPF